MLPNDNVSMSVGHLDHVSTVYTRNTRKALESVHQDEVCQKHSTANTSLHSKSCNPAGYLFHN